MNNRITKLFERKDSNILSIFYTAGFPALNDTMRIASTLEKAGADLIEIGIPFSDPVADGPTIQESSKIALDNGMTTKLLLEQVREIRKTVTIPIILMGYINPVLQYGVEKFVEDAAAAGVDGLILPDMPLYEFEEKYKAVFEAHNMCNTFLISPTTSEERIRKIDHATQGFIYAVSSSSITGAKNGFTSEQVSYFQSLKNLGLKNKFLIGFGISGKESFQHVCEYSAGGIVGSAFVTLLKNANDLEKEITTFIHELK
jgi:tryptophan synthase alpha chain